MKICIIDLEELIKIPLGELSKIFIETKLKKADFDMNKPVLSMVDAKNMQYMYTQE